MQTLPGREGVDLGHWGRGATIVALVGAIAACRPPEEPSPQPGGSCLTCPPDAGTPPGSSADSGSPVPPPRGETAWASTSALEGHERSAGLAAAPDGDTFVAEVIGLTQPYSDVGVDAVALRVRRVDATGQVRWTRRFEVTPVEVLPGDPSTREASLNAFTTAAGARAYVAGNVRGTLTGAPGTIANGGFVLAIDADGTPAWGRGVDGEVRAISARDDGALWLAVTEGGVTTLRLDGPDGASLRRVEFKAPDGAAEALTFQSLAATPEGGVLVGGGFSGTLHLGGEVLSATRHAGVFAELGADGAVRWAVALEAAAGEVSSVALAPTGERLVTGTFRDGTLRFGDDALVATTDAQRILVLAAAADGAARWGAELGPGERPVIAGVEGGAAIVAGLSRETGRPLLTVTHVDPGGVPEWRRAFAREEGPADLFAEQLTAVTFRDGDVTVAGHYSHPTDFGVGLTTPRETDTLLLRLTP